MGVDDEKSLSQNIEKMVTLLETQITETKYNSRLVLIALCLIALGEKLGALFKGIA